MGKHLILWSLIESNVPIDPKERGTGWGALMAMVKQDIEKGLIKDWGTFPTENEGYFIGEGTNLKMMKLAQQYVPYVRFKIHPVASVDEVDELVKHLTG